MKRLPIMLFVIAGLAAGAGFIQAAINQKNADKQVKLVVEADKAGGDIALLEQALVSYVNTHMGTSASYVLEGSYRRAEDAARAAANPGGNSQVYAQAQASCGGRTDSVSQARCVQNYLASNAPPAANPQSVKIPAKKDYTKKITAPGWTPDGAGIAFLAAAASAVLGIYIAVVRRIYH